MSGALKANVVLRTSIWAMWECLYVSRFNQQIFIEHLQYIRNWTLKKVKLLSLCIVKGDRKIVRDNMTLELGFKSPPPGDKVGRRTHFKKQRYRGTNAWQGIVLLPWALLPDISVHTLYHTLAFHNVFPKVMGASARRSWRGLAAAWKSTHHWTGTCLLRRWRCPFIYYQEPSQNVKVWYISTKCWKLMLRVMEVN